MADKNVLFIFDDKPNIGKAAGLLTRNGVKQIDLFSLTGDPSILQETEIGLCREGFGGFFKYDTSAMVDEQVALLREKICRWSADIGKAEINQKSVKEWFLLPGIEVSTWWFGLFSDKNPTKTGAFLRVSQVHAVRHVLESKKYDIILLAADNNSLNNAIRKMAVRFRMLVIKAPLVRASGFIASIKKSVKGLGICAEILRAGKFFFEFLRRKIVVSLYLQPKRDRLPASGSTLFVSYFPLLEKGAAQNGIFRNRYALTLQDKLKEAGSAITWIFVYVPIDGYSFKDAVTMANRFADKGEKLFFVEEFLNPNDALRGLFLWIRQIFTGLFLFGPLKTKLGTDPIGAENMPFVKTLWNESFYGPSGLEGILFSLAFKRMFGEIKDIGDCLYYFEMQPWEHALNSAKNRERPDIRSIGFQHSSISKNLFNYFYDRSETARTGSRTDLPLPDVIGCNGEVSEELLAKSGFPAVTRLEALRYLYLDGILSSPVNRIEKRRVLLAAGSGDREESARLIMLIKSAFPKKENFDIVFKGHPSAPFEKLFENMGVDAKAAGYTITNDDISVSLKEAFAVVTLSNTVMIEALAFGCEVIVPFFPDVLSLNTLIGFERYYHKTTNREDLVNTVGKLSKGYSLCDIREYRDFVRRYWDIDKGIPKWLKLLNINTFIETGKSKIKENAYGHA